MYQKCLFQVSGVDSSVPLLFRGGREGGREGERDAHLD